ncbi:hypothetical protein [Embleya sp. AB8]|uniref:hypothetical protein n=1 Tax=Embleya sp. AB8 TaxID=3156304 RepID=UPI003C72078D
MRTTIRRTTDRILLSDAAFAQSRLEIDDDATYYLYGEVGRTSGAPRIIERVMSGLLARHHINSQLVLAMEEVEQTGPDEITIRCSTPDPTRLQPERANGRQLALGEEEGPDQITTPDPRPSDIRDDGPRTYTYSKIC